MSLRWRILLFSAGGILIILALLGYFGISAARESTKQTLDERLLLTEQVARSADFNIQQAFREIGLISQSILVKVSGDDPASGSFLEDVRRFLPFNTKYIYLVDDQRNVVMAEPAAAGPVGPNASRDSYVETVFSSNRPVVSNVVFDDHAGGYVAYIMAPLPDPAGNASMVIAVAIEVSPASIGGLVNVGEASKTGSVEIVDGNGVVLATTKPENFLKVGDHGGVFAALIRTGRTSVSTCHNCHNATEAEKRAKDIITFAPLFAAPWGVVIRQPQAETLANANLLNQRLLAFGLISLLVLLPAIWWASKTVTDPINRMTVASKRIAQGSLDEAVSMPGRDEISVLSQSFDTMRTRLKDSIEKIRERTIELESLNVEKARLYENLLDKERVLTELLKHSISAGEDERKRIARELHDETSQALTSLAIGLETIAKSPPADKEHLKTALKKNQDLTIKILDDVHRLILDLRPSVLDDMGLIPALEWYAANRLGPEGIKVHLETSGDERRLPAHIEVALFRIAQEALSNIAQHARAEIASISLDFQGDCIKLTVEDDGVGFESGEVLSNPTDKRGWGLLGMVERAEALNGKVMISSKPGAGTQLNIEIPVNWNTSGGGKDE